MLTFPDPASSTQTYIRNQRVKCKYKETESEKGKEQREAHDKVENERNNEIKEKFKHWISPMSKQCLGQNCQKETCQGTHTRLWKTTQIQSNLFTQQA